MEIQFFKINNRFLPRLDEEPVWIILLGKKEIRLQLASNEKDTFEENRVRIDKERFHLLKKNYVEYFPHTGNKYQCRTCKNKLDGDWHDDGICANCWDKIILKYYNVNRYASIAESLDLNKQSTVTLTMDKLLNVVDSFLSENFIQSNIRKTSGLNRVGCFKWSGRDGKMKVKMTYSHIIPLRAQVSTVLHEFTHAYFTAMDDKCSKKDELLVQKIEVYLFNYFYKNDKYINFYGNLDYFYEYKDVSDYIRKYYDEHARKSANAIINIIETKLSQE